MALTGSCRNESTATLRLTGSVTLDSFPSASAIEFHDNRIYLCGDDASFLMILDTAYRQLDTVHYIPGNFHRISRRTKPDLESAAIIQGNGTVQLYILGSFSDQNRKSVYRFPLDDVHSFSRSELNGFDGLGLPEINIEGLAALKNNLVFAIRANTTHRDNKLIVTSLNFLDHDTKGKVHIAKLVLKGEGAPGVSGLYYVEEKDLLLFTASVEDTPSATEDGVISDSYLGGIREFSKTMHRKELYPDWISNLSSVNPSFKKQKIESVCVESVNGDELLLHLAADNDDGKSTLFRMVVKMP